MLILTGKNIISDICDEQIVVEENSELNISGIVNNKIIVRPSGCLLLHGICNGDIEIQPGATAMIYGIVNGTIYNEGSIEIFGIVETLDDISNQTQISDGAIVNGKQY